MMIDLFLLLFGAYVGYVCGINSSDWGRGFDMGYERGYERGKKEGEEHDER